MKFRVEVVCLHEGGEQRCNVLEMERTELALETLGLSVAEGKAMLHGVQDFVATQQGIEDLERKRACAACGQRRSSKEVGTYTVKTVFGPVEVPNPRWSRCACQSEGPRTFRPAAAWLQGERSSPELLYLETKWASLIPFEKVADLLKEVLPVGETTNHETIREHLQAVAQRVEDELGEEREPRDFTALDAVAELPLPDGPMTVGLDGGYVRAAHKQGCFEVIAGRSIVAFRRAEGDPVPPAKCFGFVQTYDQKPRQRLDSLFLDLDLICRRCEPAAKLARGIAEFRTYIRNNRGSIPNFGERYRQGETISTAFVESTINQVVSRRFVKKQQMGWTLKGAHLLLQTRTKVLNNELEDVFRRLVSEIPPGSSCDCGRAQGCVTPGLLLLSFFPHWILILVI